jgi:hypothetical protein
MSKKCNNCGFQGLNDNSKYCSRCGAILPEQPEKPSINSFVQAKDEGQIPVKKGSQIRGKIAKGCFYYIVFCGVLVSICLIIAATMFFFAHIGQNNSGNTQVMPTISTPINQDFSSMALTINDLPQGWITEGNPTQNATMYRSTFVLLGGSRGIPLTFTMTKYSSATEAETTFNQQKSAITNVRVDSLNIGDEGFDYQ